MYYRWLFSCLLFQLFCTFHAPAQKVSKLNVNTCLEFPEKYSDYWQKDSFGKNGVREIVSLEYLSKCNFIGKNWKTLDKHLGKSNQSFEIGNKFVKRYRLNHFSDDIKDIGTMLLDISVNAEGIIIGLKIYTVDG